MKKKDSENVQTIWKPSAPLQNSDWQYNFTKFGINLNHLTPSMNVAPTDSRNRPDQRALEEGNFNLASSEKHRLEEK
jgi:hypothetical protein